MEYKKICPSCKREYETEVEGQIECYECEDRDYSWVIEEEN